MATIVIDERRDLIIPGDYQVALEYSIKLFLDLAMSSIKDHGYFAVALSGGSTPKAIFKGILESKTSPQVDWKKVLLFWSDERCVALDHPDSNFRMAMEFFSKLPIPKSNIFPLLGTGDLEANAKAYEKLIRDKIPSKSFDLVMLGMGDDGHTASLFPKTHGLHVDDRLVIANFLPEKDVWRMTMTYDCINAAQAIVIYAFGAGKANTIKKVFESTYQPDLLPIQKVGTVEHRALWIIDKDASSDLAL